MNLIGSRAGIYCLLLCGLSSVGMPPAFAQPKSPNICYVSPTGDDSRSEGPFKTVARALQYTRARLAQLKVNGGTAPAAVEIRLRGGIYPLTEPLMLSAEDSGTGTTRLLISADATEKAAPILSGGVRLSGWKNAGGNRWQLTLPEVAEGKWYFSQLYVNGVRRFRPRLPRQGYYYIASEAEPSPKAAGKGYDRFRYKAGNIDPTWTNRDDIEVLPFHIWTMSRFGIADLDPTQRTLTLRGMRTGNFSWSRFGTGNRYLVDNVKEALDDPGEWYLDRKTGVLTYLAEKGEDPNRDTVIAPRLDQIVKINGSANVTFKGITFSYSGWNLGPNGNSAPQADINVPATISLTDSKSIIFDHCRIQNIANYGVDFGAGTQNCLLDHCVLRDLGAGGVKIGTTGFMPDETKRASGNTVQDCVIAEGGRIHPAGVGIWIGQSPNNKILHNRITDFYYSGVSVGWTWGYAPSGADHNTISYNEISNIGQGVLSDMGGIYSLGISPGTVLDHNVIHDIRSFDYGGWGIYFDEGSTDIVATNNLVYNCKSAPFHQHYGTNNLLENNILALGGDAQLMRTRADNNSKPTPDKSKELSFTVRRNIVYWNNDSPLFGSNWKGTNFGLEKNLYWKATPTGIASIRFPDDAPLSTWQTASGKDTGSLIADPKFADPAKNDFSLPSPSPAVQKIGFVPLDLHDVGPRGMGTASQRPLAPRAFPPPPPPRPIAEDGEEYTPGDKPGGPQITVNIDPTVSAADIRVTDETAASGKQSLKFTDAPGQKNRWTPHIYFKPNFAEGTVLGKFALRVGRGTVFYNEWRDSGSPYNIGPAFHVGEEGALTVSGKEIAKLPLDTWVRFEVLCTLGDKATGTFDLTLSLPGKAPQQFTGLPCDGGKAFRQVRWWGFVADGDQPATFYLDDLSLTKK
jgi:hypothetical protein